MSSDQVNKLTEQMDAVQEDVTLIKRALLGDEAWREKGLLKRVESLEKWRRGQALKVSFYSGVATTVFFVGQKVLEYLTSAK